MANISLYALTDEHKLICDAIEENGGEITPEIEAMLAINEANFVTKAEGYVEIIAKYEDMAEKCKVRKSQLDVVQRISENAVRRMKERLLQAMLEYKVEKVESGVRKLSLRNSKSVEITNEARIPNNYIKVTTKIDKTSLRADLMAGKIVEGAELKTNQTLTIR